MSIKLDNPNITTLGTMKEERNQIRFHLAMTQFGMRSDEQLSCEEHWRKAMRWMILGSRFPEGSSDERKAPFVGK